MANWNTTGAPVLLVLDRTIGTADSGKSFQMDVSGNLTLTLSGFTPGDVFCVANTSLTGRLTIIPVGGTLDDATNRIMLPNEAAIILWTGSQYIKLGGRTVPVFASVSVPQGSAYGTSGQAFTAINYNNVVSDPLQIWSTLTFKMTLPRTSLYILTTNLRFDDGSLPFSYENGSNTVPADGAWANWFDTNQSSPSTKRNGSQVARTVSAAAGDQYVGYYYADKVGPSNIISAAMTVLEIPQW